MEILEPQDRKFLLVVLAFMVLSALLTLEIEHGFPLDRASEHSPSSLPVWVDLSIREPEPMGSAVSLGREPGCLQPTQETTTEAVGPRPR